MREWVIDLGLAKPPLSLNDRLHWRPKSALEKQLRQLARVRSRHIPDLAKCSVEMVWYVNTKHRRDTDNPMATFKPLCDGLVDAEIVPDDTPQYMDKQKIRIEYRPKVPSAVHLIVKEMVADDEVHSK